MRTGIGIKLRFLPHPSKTLVIRIQGVAGGRGEIWGVILFFKFIFLSHLALLFVNSESLTSENFAVEFCGAKVCGKIAQCNIVDIHLQ